MASVFVAEDGLPGGNHPVNAKGLVEDGYATISLGSIEIVAFVLEDGRRGEDRETMCKTSGNKELQSDVGGWGFCCMFGRGE